MDETLPPEGRGTRHAVSASLQKALPQYSQGKVLAVHVLFAISAQGAPWPSIQAWQHWAEVQCGPCPPLSLFAAVRTAGWICPWITEIWWGYWGDPEDRSHCAYADRLRSLSCSLLLSCQALSL